MTIIGTIQNVIRQKGFAFVQAGGLTYFLHMSQVVDGSWALLESGVVVAFDPEQNARGLQAMRVRRVVNPTEVATDGTRN